MLRYVQSLFGLVQNLFELKKKTFENLKNLIQFFVLFLIFNRITSNEIKCLRELTPGADCLRRS